MSARRDQLHTTIAVLASAVLHASVVGVAGLTSTSLLSTEADALNTIPAAAPLPPIIEPPQPPPSPNSNTVPVGNPDSAVVTETWIGFDEFKEHIGVNRAPVDQPPLALDPPALPDQAEPSPIASPPTPPPSLAQAASTASSPTTTSADQPDPSERPANNPAEAAEPTPPQTSPHSERITLDAPQQQLPAPPDEAPPESTNPIAGNEPLPPTDTAPPKPSEPAELDGPPSEPIPPTPPLADVSPPAPEPSIDQPAVTPVPPAPPPSPSASSDARGEQTDRESDLAAIKTAAKAHLGKPLATKGLRIRTIRPRASHYNSILARYVDPVVRVHFNKRGIVEKVEFIRRSENRDVDLYVLNAIYQWTAEGPQLDELPEKDPPATIAVDFMIVRPLSG